MGGLTMDEKSVIVFDNLRQADTEMVGETKPVKALWSEAEHFNQPNAKGSLYQPSHLGDVSARAAAAAGNFRNMFPK